MPVHQLLYQLLTLVVESPEQVSSCSVTESSTPTCCCLAALGCPASAPASVTHLMNSCLLIVHASLCLEVRGSNNQTPA
jgi:hypothetical protein